eukprot:7309729-Pyramimonas_sp.AAC.1
MATGVRDETLNPSGMLCEGHASEAFAHASAAFARASAVAVSESGAAAALVEGVSSFTTFTERALSRVKELKSGAEGADEDDGRDDVAE